MDMILETIAAMRQQESSGYTVNSFLHQDDPAESVPANPLNVTADCRSRMVNWMYQIADYCSLQRLTCSIAANYLDRFIAADEGCLARQDPQIYQLAAMTCLYTAVKIHEPQALDLKSTSNLSRGVYSADDIKAMEECILFALKWKVNPPTAMAFVQQFLELIPEDVITNDVRQAVYDITKYQTELAVNECALIPIKASVVAYCALMNSLESVGVDDKVVGQIGYVLSHAIGVNCLDDEIIEVQSALYKAVVKQSKNEFSLAQQPSGSFVGKPGNNVTASISTVSPRSIYDTR